MRILMLNNEFPPLGGGTATVNEAILKEFSKDKDITVDLVTSSLDSSFHTEIFSNKITIFRLPVGTTGLHHATIVNLLRYSFSGLRFARKLTREHRYDISFAWSTVPAGAIAFILQKANSLPYVVRVTGPDIPGFEERYRFIYPFLKPIIKKIWACAKTVITKCSFEDEEVTRLEPTAHIQRIPNAVDSNFFNPGNLSKTSHSRLRLICVARLVKRKGQDLLINALSQLTKQGIECSLTLVGTGDEEAKYKKLAQDLLLSDRISFLGYVPRSEIPALFSAHDVFVLASHNEGMSVASLEALAAGLPLVVSDCGGSKDIVTHGENGFIFAKGNMIQFIEYITLLSVDFSLKNTMSNASGNRASKISWSTTAQSIKQFLYAVSLK